MNGDLLAVSVEYGSRDALVFELDERVAGCVKVMQRCRQCSFDFLNCWDREFAWFDISHCLPERELRGEKSCTAREECVSRHARAHSTESQQHSLTL